jgi:coproporphyrinogen III oxidase-like Fe-S oxidoreductase
MVFKSFDILRTAGFDNVNLDLMFAIPGQTMAVWRETLAEALSLGSEHLSCYEVIYEEDTPLFTQLQAGEFAVDEDLACAMYDELVEQARTTGLRQYEVANFARDDSAVRNRQSTIPSFACKHNINYWRGGSFYGLGPSATSYLRGVRTKNWSNTQLYCEQLEKGKRRKLRRARRSPAPAKRLRFACAWLPAGNFGAWRRLARRVGSGHGFARAARMGVAFAGTISPHEPGTAVRRRGCGNVSALKS